MDYDKIPYSKARPVVVEWSDITRTDNWNEKEEASAIDVATIGFLLSDTNTETVIAGSYNFSDEQWSDIHVFPKRSPEITDLRKK